MGIFFGRIGTILVAFTLLTPVGALAETGVIDKRKEDFKLLRKSMGDIKSVAEGAAGVETATAPATVIAEVAKRLVAKVNFPAGSGEGDTKALPLIWTDPAGFDAKAKALETASAALLASANSKNLEAIKTGFENTTKACRACHDAYRAK